MRTDLSVLLLCFLLVSQVNMAFGQTDQSLYLLSNLEKLSADASEFEAIQKIINDEKGDFTILVTGDFIDKDGFEKDQQPDEIKKLDRLIALAGDQGKIVFVPGDREWDDGEKGGLKKVKALEKFFKDKPKSSVRFLSEDGCVGPEIMDIGTHLRIVAIDTQWFLQKEKRPEEEDAKCGVLNEKEFWDVFDDAIADSDNRNVVVALHHPPVSYGQYAGYKLFKQHFTPPVIGSMIAAFHQNVGNRKDLSHHELKDAAGRLLSKARHHPGIIFVSGHEYDLQILYDKKNYFINSGSLAEGRPVAKGKKTIYKQKKTGFAKLVFSENGEVKVQAYSIDDRREIKPTFNQTLFSSPCKSSYHKIPVNNLYNPCPKVQEEQTFKQPISGSITPGPHYKAKGIRRFFLGENYRSTWATPIHNIPFLNLDTIHGGLTPYAKGGAAQTLSLKFKNPEGIRYSFRSVDKDPSQRADESLVEGVYGDIVRDLTSTQHPYGSIIVTTMMDELDLAHSGPTLYLMPDSPVLESYRDEFAGRLGWLELKPRGDKKDRPGFKKADKVVSTFEMYGKLLDDNDNKVDVEAFATARVFDLWVSDWDRHEKNWKWLAYKKEKGYEYVPFPKDRDKALSTLEGFYSVMDWEFVAPDMASFGKKYGGLKSLNYKNRTMDRWLANTYNYEDWMRIVKKVQTLMSDEVIANAISSIPPEVQALSREKLTKTLKIRRAKLPEEMTKYYSMLAKYIDLVGSNSRDLFELTRLENGDVQAKIFKLNKKGKKGLMLYDRLIKRSETKEIRLHGLGKDDEFKVMGTAKKSILIRIIGGDGKDVITDHSKVSGLKKMTKVYDKRQKDELSLGSEGKVKSTPAVITFKTDNMFSDNKSLVLPSLSYNIDDGFSLGFNGNITQHGFNKPGFSRKFSFQASGTTKGSYDGGINATFRHVIEKWDLVTGVNITNRNRNFRRFYGLGNNTKVDEALNDVDFYTNNMTSFETYIGFTRKFWTRSSFTSTIFLNFKEVIPEPEDGQQATIYDRLPLNNGLGDTDLIGPELELDIDFRDNGSFPTKGMQFTLKNYTFFNNNIEGKLGGRIQSTLSAFFTKGIRVPVTLSLKGGVSHAYGNTPFFYKSFLGQQNNHRGLRRNRFGGETAAWLNTDLRLHFGTVATAIVPIKFGIYGLYDLGQVWTPENDSNTIHTAIGGGFYVVPYVESFTITAYVAKSEDEPLLFNFGVGFFLR